MRTDSPPILSFVGCDGSGKSTLARHAVGTLRRLGRNPVLVWSRFNNLTSKPLLALARLTGENRWEFHDGVRYGYHDFGRTAWLRWLFPRLQAIDVNLATRKKLRAAVRAGDVLVFERGPWDTLADVILDTDDFSLVDNAWGRRMTAQVRGRGPVFWITRSREAILACRPELTHDRKLDAKMEVYRRLSGNVGWRPFDNNRPLSVALADLDAQLTACVDAWKSPRKAGVNPE
jgi:hypothetical protein